MPNCSCTHSNKIQHRHTCSFYSNFMRELSDFEDLTTMNFEDFDMAYGDYATLCCCQPNIPHDESIKFVITGTDEAMDRPLFKNRKEGELMLDQDVNQMNKLQHIIDTQMLVGRNKELQKIC